MLEKVEEELILQRLHLRVSKTDISILYRPIHTYIAFVKNDEQGRNEVKRLATMSRDEFKDYLSKVIGLPVITESEIRKCMKSDAEKWFTGAWQKQTKDLLLDLNVVNPLEKPILTKEFKKD